MNLDSNFYICPICFKTSEVPGTHHGLIMIHYEARYQGRETRKPLMDITGRVLNPAPIWFLRATAIVSI